jgi:GT2 family glycosyltransferase
VPRASIVIPTWNQAGLLAATLRSLRTQTFRDFETVVADNGSDDGTAALLGRDFPEVRLVALPENRGFAAATNAGLRAAQGEILVCLNNDVECEPGWLAALVAALDRMPAVGSVASKMVSAAEPGTIDSAGDTMSLVAWNVGRGEPDGAGFSVGREILSACAGAAAYRRALFERVGWFDEAYFAWFEDVDLGIRAQLAGFRCWYEPSAVVHHHGSATAARMSDRKLYLSVRNRLVLFFKTMPLRRVLLWGPLVLASPWLDPLIVGRPIRVTARAWFAFWPMLPAVLRARRAVYAGRRVPVTRLTGLLESPWSDLGRALATVRSRLGRGAAATRATAGGRA